MKTFIINWKVLGESQSFRRVAVVGPYRLLLSMTRWGLYYVTSPTTGAELQYGGGCSDIVAARKELLMSFKDELSRFEAEFDVVDLTTPEALFIDGARDGDSFTSVEEYVKLAKARGDIPEGYLNVPLSMLLALERSR